jgi:hypothetical protein
MQFCTRLEMMIIIYHTHSPCTYYGVAYREGLEETRKSEMLAEPSIHLSAKDFLNSEMLIAVNQR